VVIGFPAAFRGVGIKRSAFNLLK